MSAPTEHATYRVVIAPGGKVRGVCACGWRSEPVSRAGIAGAAWDRHVAEMTDTATTKEGELEIMGTTLLERLVDCAGGWGDRVTDWAESYAEPGYSTRGPGIVFGDWNPRRFPRGDDTPLSKEENIGPRLAAALEWLGYELEWCDEWTRCDECYRAIRTQPDSYGWKMFGAWVDDCGYVCADCLRADMATSLEPYCNDPRDAVTWATSADMAVAGWTRWEPTNPHDYESGWHPGQDDDPVAILADIRRETDADVVFLIGGVGQFDVQFSAWTRDDIDNNNEEES